MGTGHRRAGGAWVLPSSGGASLSGTVEGQVCRVPPGVRRATRSMAEGRARATRSRAKGRARARACMATAWARACRAMARACMRAAKELGR